MLQVKNVKSMRKFTMLRVGNTYNKPLQSCRSLGL